MDIKVSWRGSLPMQLGLNTFIRRVGRTGDLPPQLREVLVHQIYFYLVFTRLWTHEKAALSRCSRNHGTRGPVSLYETTYFYTNTRERQTVTLATSPCVHGGVQQERRDI